MLGGGGGGLFGLLGGGGGWCSIVCLFTVNDVECCCCSPWSDYCTLSTFLITFGGGGGGLFLTEILGIEVAGIFKWELAVSYLGCSVGLNDWVGV